MATIAYVNSTSTTTISATSNGTGANASKAIQGFSTNQDGIHGQSSSNAHSGVWAENTAGGYGLAASTSSTTSDAVWGSNSGGGAGAGVRGTSTTGTGVKGSTAGSTSAAVWGDNTGGGRGVSGTSSGTWSVGVLGDNASSLGWGVKGTSANNLGVVGNGPIGVGGVGQGVNNSGVKGWGSGGAYALYGEGPVHVSGALTGPDKQFVIDHPLDPTRKDLFHACVESAERKNIYDGRGTADANGELVVKLPDWFSSLNRDLRYQLTALGQPAPSLHVREEFRDGQFVIAGAVAAQEICWQVTGVRNDAFARAHPFAPERDKTDALQGKYRHPVEHGQPVEKGLPITPGFHSPPPEPAP